MENSPNTPASKFHGKHGNISTESMESMDILQTGGSLVLDPMLIYDYISSVLGLGNFSIFSSTIRVYATAVNTLGLKVATYLFGITCTITF